jgi:hypothetical protein
MYPLEIPDPARGWRRNAADQAGHVCLHVLEAESLEQALERIESEELGS